MLPRDEQVEVMPALTLRVGGFREQLWDAPRDRTVATLEGNPRLSLAPLQAQPEEHHDGPQGMWGAWQGLQQLRAEAMGEEAARQDGAGLDGTGQPSEF